MRKRTRSAQPSKCLFHMCKYQSLSPLLLAYSLSSQILLLPLFLTVGLHLYFQITVRQPRQTCRENSVRKRERGWPEGRRPLRPCLDGAPQQKPPEARAQQRGPHWGLTCNLQPFENQEKSSPRPSCFPFLPKAHLFSAVTAERPQEPPRDLFNAVENLNPCSLAERTNQTAGTWQSQPPDWSYKSLNAGSQDKGRATTCPEGSWEMQSQRIS